MARYRLAALTHEGTQHHLFVETDLDLVPVQRQVKRWDVEDLPDQVRQLAAESGASIGRTHDCPECGGPVEVSNGAGGTTLVLLHRDVPITDVAHFLTEVEHDGRHVDAVEIRRED